MESLQEFICKYPESKTGNVLLGYTYYRMGMWKNAIGYFKSMDYIVFFSKAELYYMTAYAYGRVKEYKKEEEYYKLCLEEDPLANNALYYMGASLYRQKRFLEAKDIYEKCLERNVYVTYAANEYVRVLIAIKRYLDAKNFIKEGKYNIRKSLKKKVASLPRTNARINYAKMNNVNYKKKDTTLNKNREVKEKRFQFVSEKLLEDELEAQIEAGFPVFGMVLKLKDYNGKHGRQVILPNTGRLDLLCEDAVGNIYVIELKKDSGYDDAYEKVHKYMDYFKQEKEFKGRNVYGIICLNAHDDEIVEKVHRDKEVKLFEYKVVFDEK